MPTKSQALKLLKQIAQENYYPSKVGLGPLVLYGEGKLGKLAKDYLDYVGCWYEKSFKDDDNPLTTFDPSYYCAVVCIVTAPYKPIENRLYNKGFGQVINFYDLTNYFTKHPLSYGWHASDLTDHDLQNISHVLETWADNRSRAHHLQFLAWRKLRQEWDFDYAPVSLDDQFIIPEMKLTDDDIFLDGGYCFGEVVDKLQARGLNFKKTIVVDAQFPKIPSVKFRAVEAILAENNGILPFKAGFGYCSRVDHTSSDIKAAVTIDSLNEPITFIKLHLEGYELSALKGAKNTLQGFRPIVAATVCHNSDGIWKTPLWLMENLTDYTFLFRQHCWCGSNAVIYAIPKERL